MIWIKGIGAFIVIEGASNIWYWWYDKHPWYFQVGRLLRTVFGIVLVVLG